MMEKFVKKYWEEDQITFYIHFLDSEAIRQIEVTENGTIFLDDKNPIIGESMLFDQSIEGLELDRSNFISKEEFEDKWNN